MVVSSGVDITATQFNVIRNSTYSILSSLYGQTMLSTAAIAGNSLVSSERKRNLFLDIQRIHFHQRGSLNIEINIPPVGATISADTSQNYNQATGEFMTLPGGNLMGYNDYVSAVSTNSNFEPSTPSIWPSSNFSLGTEIASMRTTAWGGSGQVQSIFHILNFTFANSNALNHYFKAGGELRFSANHEPSVSDQKNVNWQQMLEAIGIVRFNGWRISANSGAANPEGSGLNSLTSTYRTLFTKAGSGIYSSNQYTIEARFSSARVLRFRIRFNDADTGNPPAGFPGTGIDESVQGTTTSRVNTFRPDSNFIFNSQPVIAVSLPAPSIAQEFNLSTDTAMIPA